MGNDYKTALITGASSGLGRGLAAWFVKRGTKVYAAGRREDQLQSLIDETKGAPGTIVPVKLDVAETATTLARVREIDQECGGLDLIVANAGIGLDTYAKRMKWENVEQTIQVNVTGAAATLCAVLPQMVERNRGHLVGVSSIAGYRGLPRMAAYCASKSFLAVFLESLRVDLQATQVRVTNIRPGFVKSEMTAKNKYKMPFLLETDDAVERMGSAILRGASEFAFPWQLASTAQMLKLMPNAVYDKAAKRLRG